MPRTQTRHLCTPIVPAVHKPTPLASPSNSIADSTTLGSCACEMSLMEELQERLRCIATRNGALLLRCHRRIQELTNEELSRASPWTLAPRWDAACAEPESP